MRLSWKMGRVAGIDLFLHPSALLVFLFASDWMPSGLETMTLVLALFGSILLHELGHALMARRYGIDTADITLYVFGGVAHLERMPRSAGPELLIALAGPSVNFAIALALFGVTGLADLVGMASPEFVTRVFLLNLGLGLFNLLPIFPMDGGRILRAILSGPFGRVRATEVAATLGRVIAVAGVIYFLTLPNLQGAFLALFVYIAASMELRQVRDEARPNGLPEDFADVPPPPAGFRWVSRGDGVWRLAPIMVDIRRQDRSWN